MFLFCHTQYKHYAYISCHVSDVFRMHFLLKHSTEMMNEVVSVSHKVWNTYNNLPVICKTLFFYNYSSFEKILFCIFIIIKYCKNSTMNNKNNLLTACVHLKHFTLGAVPLNSCALKYKREVSNSYKYFTFHKELTKTDPPNCREKYHPQKNSILSILNFTNYTNHNHTK